MKNTILKIKQENPSFGYKKIAKIVGCAPNTVKYYLLPDSKEKNNIRQNRRRKHCPILKKMNDFKYKKSKHAAQFKVLGFLKRIKGCTAPFIEEKNFTLGDVLLKIGTEPKCFLTGKSIDINDSSSYSFDHLTPVSKGGLNTLDNLVITSRIANQAKYNLPLDEFIKLCRDVVNNFPENGEVGGLTARTKSD